MIKQARIRTMFFPVFLAGSLAFGCSDDEEVRESSDSGIRQDASLDGATPSRSDAATDAGPGMDAAGSNVDAGDAGVLTNAQILGVLQTVNDGEIAAATIAKNKPAQNPAVLNYANQMIAMHSAANAALPDAGTPPSSPEQVGLQAMATTLAGRLQGLSPGANFDLEYMESQADAHQMVLTVIDTRLRPFATGSLLATLTTQVQPMVSAHRTEAVAIISTLSDSGIADSGVSDGGDASATDGGADAAP